MEKNLSKLIQKSKILEMKIKNSSGEKYFKLLNKNFRLYQKIIELKEEIKKEEIKQQQKLKELKRENKINKIVKQATRVVKATNNQSKLTKLINKQIDKLENKNNKINTVIYITVYTRRENGQDILNEDELLLKRKIEKKRQTRRTKRTGYKLRIFNHFIVNIDFNADEYKNLNFYNFDDDRKLFYDFKSKFLNTNYFLELPELKEVLGNYMDGFVITQRSRFREIKNKDIKYLTTKYKADEEHKAINSNFTKYVINKDATNFKNLIEIEYNEYLKKNLRPNSCFLTCIINKFYRRFEERKKTGARRYPELTYDYLCEFLKIKNKPSDISCSVRNVLPFFERYNLGLFLYDEYQSLVYKFEPPIKNKHYSELNVIAKGKHLYSINNKHRALCKEIKNNDKEVEQIYVSNKFCLSFHEEEDVKKHIINNMDDVVKYIKLYKEEVGEKKKDKKNKKKDNDEDNEKDNKNSITIKLITSPNLDLSNLLIDIFESGYIPKVFFNNIVYKITLVIDNLYISIESPDITTQSERIICIESIEQYDAFHDADDNFTKSILKEDYLSTYHPSVLEIENNYKIVPDVGGIDSEKKNTVNGLDMCKCYTNHLSNITKVPVFDYFDIYRKYENEEIEDYTYYIIKLLDNKNKEEIIFREKYSRVYGFVLKEVKFRYHILYFKKPNKIVNVNFKSHIDELYKNDKIDKDIKKYIVNKLTGVLEKKINKNSVTKFFDKLSHAYYYKEKYDGCIIPIKKSITDEDIEKWEKQGLSDMEIVNEVGKVKPSFYIVNVNKKAQLSNGFVAIKDIIYCRQKVLLYQQYHKMKSLGLKPVGVKTDCLLYEGDDEIVRKNFQIGENIGDFRIEKGKYVSETILKIENNELMDIIDYSKCIPKEFDDEKDTKVINEFLEQNKNIFVRALNPGCGKSTLVKNFNKKTLFVLTENTLCRDVRKEGIDAITADRLFGSFGNQRKPFDYSAYGCICFDEIGKYGLDKLKLISNFIYNNPDIYIYGAGDSDQIKPINYNGTTIYLSECINILFPKQILLKINKRQKKEEDVKRLEDLKDYIFKTNHIDALEMCKRFNLNYIKNYSKVKTENNLVYFNFRARYINQMIHFEVKQNKKKWFEGLEIVCRKYYKDKAFKLYVNYTYKIHKINKNKVTIYDDIDDEYYTFHDSILETHFSHTYARTIDSSQGRTLTDKLTIFDIGLHYTSRAHIWVALTRNVSLDNVTVFIHSEEEIQRFGESKMKQYLKEKVKNYINQDKIAGRQIDKEDYVDDKFIWDKFHESGFTCSYCNKPFDIGFNEGSFYTNITMDRINNDLSHTKSNCVIACTRCNVSKK